MVTYLYSLHARKIMSTCNMIMLICNKNMSTYKMIMFTCDFNYAACQHNYVACWHILYFLHVGAEICQNSTEIKKNFNICWECILNSVTKWPRSTQKKINRAGEFYIFNKTKLQICPVFFSLVLLQSNSPHFKVQGPMVSLSNTNPGVDTNTM